MARIYATLIKRNMKKIEEIPEIIREEVQAILDAEKV